MTASSHPASRPKNTRVILNRDLAQLIEEEQEKPVDEIGRRGRADVSGGHCQSKVAGLSYSTEDRGLGLPELTPLGKCSGAVELEIIP